MKIRNVFDFNKALHDGPYAWPGGYPRFFFMADGEALSFEAAVQNAGLIRDAIIDAGRQYGGDDMWCAVACEVNWEDTDLRCAHTEELIPSAYGGD